VWQASFYFVITAQPRPVVCFLTFGTLECVFPDVTCTIVVPVLVLRYVHIHATDVSVMAGTDVSVLSDICIRDPWGKITDASVILVFRIRLS
jgi:hypothetical protein